MGALYRSPSPSTYALRYLTIVMCSLPLDVRTPDVIERMCVGRGLRKGEGEKVVDEGEGVAGDGNARLTCGGRVF